MTWDDEPWTRGNLRITRAALAEIEREAVAGYLADHEVCGLLAGPSSDPLLCDRVIPIENLAKVLHERDPVGYPQDPRTFFAFHERTLEAALRDGRNRDAPVKVLYHSHLDVGAYLSGADQALLSRGGLPSTPDGPALLGRGPAWPLAFLVTSVRIAGGDSSPQADEHRLFVWDSGAFADAAFTLT